MTLVQEAQAFFAVGNVFEQVENTYQPSSDGIRRRVDKVGKSFYDCTPLDGPHAGKPHRGSIPTRAVDVVALNDHTITFYLDQKLERLKGHTITLRRVAA